MRLKALFFTALVSLTAFADSDKFSNGYYRVQNAYTERYLYLMDNKGSVNYHSGTADCGAIVPYKNLSKAVSDPASVMYFQQYGTGYTFYAQGTSTTDILNVAIQLTAYRDGWLCWASSNGLTKYLADKENILTEDKGVVGTTDASFAMDQKKWYIYPITADGDNYLGVKPTIEVGGKYYASYYVSFPFKTYSEGMKVYVVKMQAGGRAVLSELTTDVVPAETPVLIECSSSDPSDNRLDIQMGSYTSISGNKLSGNFFRYGEDRSDEYTHKNVTPFVTATDRVFGVTSDGKLGLITPTETYIPANTAYLRSTEANLPSEIAFVSEDEYNGIKDVQAETTVGDDKVYNMQGMLVGKRTDTLKPGIYVINGKKTIVK